MLDRYVWQWSSQIHLIIDQLIPMILYGLAPAKKWNNATQYHIHKVFKLILINFPQIIVHKFYWTLYGVSREKLQEYIIAECIIEFNMIAVSVFFIVPIDLPQKLTWKMYSQYTWFYFICWILLIVFCS